MKHEMLRSPTVARALLLTALFGCAEGVERLTQSDAAQTEVDMANTSEDDASLSPADGAIVGSPGSDAGSSDMGRDAAISVPDAGTMTTPPVKAGNPDGKCSGALPAEAKAVDASRPSTVVGTGTAASCSFDALNAAIQKGGVVTFSCGQSPATIAITSTIEFRTDRSTVIDGGNKVTLDGGNKVRIFSWRSSDWQKNSNTLTLQHIVLANGKATGTEMIPKHPEPCSQGFNDGEGGALFMRDGSLRAIDVSFIGNRAAELGPDTGGGALYLLGSRPAYISGCTFKDNKASNGGAMASLFTPNFIYDSLFEDSAATGYGANYDDQSMCSYMNNEQYEVGSGGNGGAIYNDGVGADVTVCGTQVRNSTSGAFGAAIFFTSNSDTNKGTLTIRDSLMFNNVPKNTGWQWKPGISTNADTIEPVNSDIRR